MTTLPLFSLSLSCLSRSHSLCYSTKNKFSSTNQWLPKSTEICFKPVVFAGKSIRPTKSQFLDENGDVEDMDGYMNNLSLEYDSVWDTKPSWCQPWTIALTGALIIALSWLVVHSVAVTTIISILIFAWWYIFLYSYPKSYADMIAERRDRITTGAEDTFGSQKNQ